MGRWLLFKQFLKCFSLVHITGFSWDKIELSNLPFLKVVFLAKHATNTSYEFILIRSSTHCILAVCRTTPLRLCTFSCFSRRGRSPRRIRRPPPPPGRRTFRWRGRCRCWAGRGSRSPCLESTICFLIGVAH